MSGTVGGDRSGGSGPGGAARRLAPSISAVVPAYNEEGTLAAAVRTLLPALEAVGAGRCEVIVVDDGSEDATAAVLAGLCADPRVRGIRLPRNRGKGAALRAGVAASRGELVLICDADLATPPELLPRFVTALDAGADLAIGSRRLQGSVVLRAQPRARVLLGRLHTALANRMFGVSLSDFTCGFKLFRGPVARRLFAASRSDRWGYDVEVVTAALGEGLCVREVPVAWRDGPRTKVRVLGATASTLYELVRARFRSRPRSRGGAA